MTSFQKTRRLSRTLIAALLCTVLAGSTACTSEEDNSDDDLLLLAGLASAFSAQNPGSCDFTFGTRSVPMQEITLSASTTAAATTTVAFNFSPVYIAGGNEFWLVYNEAACPIGNESNADLNYTFPDLASTRTPTNYTFDTNTNTFSFNGTGAGKDFTIIAATSSPPTDVSITRTN